MMNVDLENEKCKFINQVVGKDVVKNGGEVMNTVRYPGSDEVKERKIMGTKVLDTNETKYDYILGVCSLI